MGSADFLGPAWFPLVPLESTGLPEPAQSLSAWSKGYKHSPGVLPAPGVGVAPWEQRQTSCA